MILNKVYSYDEIDFSIDQVPSKLPPQNVLMCTPDYFDVVDIKNVYMEGNAGKIDKKLVHTQWKSISNIYGMLVSKGTLKEATNVNGVEGLEDMVFAANQTFPWITESGEKVVIMSKMRHESRRREVVHFENYFNEKGYKILQLQKTDMFEGMGDTIPHVGKNLLYGGYGHRSKKEAYEEISSLLNVPVIALELIDDRFYHLDTCFVPLDEDTVMLCPNAFSYESFEAIKKLFKKVIRIPAEEAASTFSLNVHCVYDKQKGEKHAIIHYGSIFTYNALVDNGYQVYEVNTSEFMKSGGSVFCMKMMYY
jgi:N-dimethylarginine dimethylaminohydrolase